MNLKKELYFNIMLLCIPIYVTETIYKLDLRLNYAIFILLNLMR
jgi:hypothetical protein